jgi:hypothetical protein
MNRHGKEVPHALGTVSTRDILIQTENLEAASAFYENVLGVGVFMREDTMIGLESGALRLFLDKAELYGPALESRSSTSKRRNGSWSRPAAGSRTRTGQCRAARSAIPMA